MFARYLGYILIVIQNANSIYRTRRKFESVILGKAKGCSRGSSMKAYLKLDPRPAVEDDTIFVSIFKSIRYIFFIIGFLSVIITPTALAAVYTLPANGDNVVGGEDQNAAVKVGDTATTFAERNDIGYYQLLEANPYLDPLRMGTVSRLLVPHQTILPDAPREGIVVNLPELRLYYYPPGSNTVVVFPVGIGRIGDRWQTPIAELTIIEKTKDPEWRVPQSVAEDMIKRGKPLPEVIPPGPDNPLGGYRMRLSNLTYLIHGTNHPYVVGRRTSSGCINMYPEDIEQLFNMVPVDTKVTIVDQPFKAGWLNGKLYFEAHRPLREDRFYYAGRYDSLWNEALNNATTKRVASVDWNEIHSLAAKEMGVAEVVGEAATPSAVLAKDTSTLSEPRPSGNG
jgi:L,D-transpeptidase ErfK/SrfK